MRPWVSKSIPIRPREPAATISDVALMKSFTSLGDNCEFGAVQRACSAEPLGLFRFNSSSLDNICDVLETRLAHLFTDADLDVFEEPGLDEYMCRSRHYKDFYYHTHVSPTSVARDAHRTRELKKIEYLKGRLIDDLGTGEIIFVRKGAEPLQGLRRLHKALNAYGPNVLLIVDVADSWHPAGSVDSLGEGLIRGYISEFKNFARSTPIDLIGWTAVCRRAHAMVYPTVRLAPPKRLAKGEAWTSTNSCRVDRSARLPRPPTGQACNRLTSLHDTGPNDVLASHPIPAVKPGKPILFSAWVWVTEHYVGHSIDAWLLDIVPLHSHPVDLSRRNVWQQTWVSAKGPQDGRTLTGALRSGGVKGSVIMVSGWTAEAGTVPRPAPPSLRARASIIRRRIACWSMDGRRAVAAVLNRAVLAIEPPDAAMLDRRNQQSDMVKDRLRKRAASLLAKSAFIAADDMLTRALTAFPSDPAFAKLYALSAHNSGRYAPAIDRWTGALNAAPDDPMCFAGLAANLRESGALDRAADVIANALLRFADNEIVITEAARIAERRQLPADAVKLWERAIELCGPYGEWQEARARALKALSVDTSL